MAEKTVKELKIALHKAISEFSDNVRSSRLSPQKLRNLNKEIEIAAQSLDSLHSEIDAVKRPHDVFDPGNPRTIGFFIALALTTQKRTSLSAIQSAYGSGVYALYYIGDYVHYSTISGAETPIYVGQAAPERFDARTPREQGATIAARLSEHRKTIERAAGNLSINDFECRVLVVQTGWETAAEDYLIRLFKPVWNKEIKILQGFGKHGDAPTTRINKVSSWDVFHPGRAAAGAGINPVQKSEEKIASELSDHFARVRTYGKVEEVLAEFISALRQH